MEASLCGWCVVLDSVGTCTCKKVRQPLLAVCVDGCMISVLGTESKPLLMLIVARTVRCAGFGAFRRSSLCFVCVVRSVDLECLALKPCWLGEIFYGLRIGTIFPSFQMLGIVYR